MYFVDRYNLDLLVALQHIKRNRPTSVIGRVSGQRTTHEEFSLHGLKPTRTSAGRTEESRGLSLQVEPRIQRPMPTLTGIRGLATA